MSSLFQKRKMRNIKKVSFVFVMLCGIFGLMGCGHTHEFADATCSKPKTCVSCGKTEGTSLEHIWENATCEHPKTCKLCGLTEGETLEHVWEEATCATPKICKLCGLTEGKTLDHIWIEATCTTPKICELCETKDGEPLGHQWGDIVCNQPSVCDICGEIDNKIPEHQWNPATCNESKTCSVCGETEGKPLGHTTDSGKCERCGTTIKKTWSGHKGGNPLILQSVVCRRHNEEITEEMYESWEHHCGDVYVTYSNGIESFTKMTCDDYLPSQFDGYYCCTWEDNEQGYFLVRIWEESEEGIEDATLYYYDSHTKLHYVNPLDYVIEQKWFDDRLGSPAQWEWKFY